MKRKRKLRISITAKQAMESINYLLDSPELNKMGITSVKPSLQVMKVEMIRDVCKKFRKRKITLLKFIQELRDMNLDNFQIIHLLKKNKRRKK